MSSLHIFLHPLFKNVTVPLLTLPLTIFLKASGKDKFSVVRSDFFVCFDLCITALFLFIIRMIDLIGEYVNPPNKRILNIIKSQSSSSQSFDSEKLA